MIKKKYKCRNCGYEFVKDTIESKEEFEEISRRNDPRRRPVRIQCPKCGIVVS